MYSTVRDGCTQHQARGYLFTLVLLLLQYTVDIVESILGTIREQIEVPNGHCSETFYFEGSFSEHVFYGGSLVKRVFDSMGHWSEI